MQSVGQFKADAAKAGLGYSRHGLFSKANKAAVAFSKTGAGTASLLAGTYVDVAGVLLSFLTDTAITMPTLTAGTDYAIYACTDHSVRADASFSAPTGYTTANSRKIGGFHYAPGGNAPQLTCAAVPAGTAIGAQTVPINTWALYLLSVNAAGAIAVTPAAANATTGYATSALAIAAMPSIPAASTAVGYITVQTKTGTTWVAGTDALAGGTSGNVANATTYVPLSAAALGLTLSRGTIDTNIASTAFTYYLGGDSTPQINAESLWDLKFRPSVPDPRGLMLIPGQEAWGTIYFLGVNHITDGPSRYGATIADGSSPPKIPLQFGGDGTKTYPNCNWWTAAEVLAAYGFRPPTYQEYAAMAYGVTEATSRGTDPVTTGLDAARTSKCGMMQATGSLWVWGADFGGGAAAAGYVANTGGRGSTYQLSNAVFFGGDWGDASDSGSAASHWGYSPAFSYIGVAVRGVCDHLILD